MTPGDRWLVTSTVMMEAEGEPYDGKLAVAWVIKNRMTGWAQSASGVCLASMQFSCWNNNEPRRRVLSRLFTAEQWVECQQAVDEVFSGLNTDPTRGATHYLNEAVTHLARADHALPSWFKEEKVTVRIGHHTFLKL